MSSVATTRMARVVSEGPRTARPAVPMSRPIRAEIPDPPADAVGQPDDHEAAEGEHVGTPVRGTDGRGGSPTLLIHCFM
jgi:hypothetical protein